MPNPITQSARKLYHRTRFVFDTLRNYGYDYTRHIKYSATLAPALSQKRFQGRITANYHVIEKGLAFKDTRVGFGVKVVEKLVSLLETYQARYGLDEVCQVALNVLYQYYQFNLEHGLEKADLLEKLDRLKATLPTQGDMSNDGGTLQISKDEIKQASAIDFRAFSAARHSVRHFSEAEVDAQAIEAAVAMALKTPCVCNRQSWKVYAFSGDEKDRVLSYQSGNRGFGTSANKVLVVTTDLNYFIGAKERNQCFIDGGLFSMSLVYALHSLGLGTCCLNWSVTYETDKKLKKAINISQAESVIMMIAVGHLPDQLKVAFSARKSWQDVLVMNS